MAITVRRLAIARLTDADRPNYLLSDAHTGEGVAQVEWLNVDGAPFAFGGSADDVACEFGGEHVARVALANEREDTECPDRLAAGARITLMHEDDAEDA